MAYFQKDTFDTIDVFHYLSRLQRQKDKHLGQKKDNFRSVKLSSSGQYILAASKMTSWRLNGRKRSQGRPAIRCTEKIDTFWKDTIWQRVVLRGPVSRFEFEQTDLAMTSLLATQPVT